MDCWKYEDGLCGGGSGGGDAERQKGGKRKRNQTEARKGTCMSQCPEIDMFIMHQKSHQFKEGKKMQGKSKRKRKLHHDAKIARHQKMDKYPHS